MNLEYLDCTILKKKEKKEVTALNLKMKGDLTKFQKVLYKTALKCVKIGHGNQFLLFPPSKIASFECKTRKADTTLLGFSIKKAIIMFASQFLLVSKDDGGRLCQKASTQNTCTQCNKAPFLLSKLLEVHYSTRVVLRRDAGLKMAKRCDACISKHASTKSQTKISRVTVKTTQIMKTGCALSTAGASNIMRALAGGVRQSVPLLQLSWLHLKALSLQSIFPPLGRTRTT